MSVTNMREPYATQPNELLDRYGNLILHIAFSYLGSLADAEDVCQMVLLRLLETGRRFESPERERAWVIRVACNLCKDQLRATRRHPHVARDTMTEPASNPGDQTIEALDGASRRVLSAVAKLPPAQRVAIYLHYYEGYSAKRIAELTGRNPATVAVHLSRGRARLRKLLEEDES